MRFRLRTLLIVLALGPPVLWLLAMMWDAWGYWDGSGDSQGLEAVWKCSVTIAALIALFAMLVFVKDRISSN
jgi:hypothetical protein